MWLFSTSKKSVNLFFGIDFSKIKFIKYHNYNWISDFLFKDIKVK